MTRNRWLALLAAGVLVGIENYAFFRPGGEAKLSDASAWEAAEASPAPNAAPEPLSYADLVVYAGGLSGDARSPFLTADEWARLAPGVSGPATGAGTTPVLAGTLWSPTRRVAWIGDTPRSEGDTVGAYRIEVIEPRAAVLRAGRRTVRLELKQAAAAPHDPGDENAPEPAGDEETAQ